MSRRVRALLDFKNIFGYSLKEYREDAWLTEFDYVVNHNGNSLLDITFIKAVRVHIRTITRSIS